MLDKKGVGKRIAYYRKEHGMTQKDLAALLNISYRRSQVGSGNQSAYGRDVV